MVVDGGAQWSMAGTGEGEPDAGAAETPNAGAADSPGAGGPPGQLEFNSNPR